MTIRLLKYKHRDNWTKWNSGQTICFAIVCKGTVVWPTVNNCILKLENMKHVMTSRSWGDFQYFCSSYYCLFSVLFCCYHIFLLAAGETLIYGNIPIGIIVNVTISAFSCFFFYFFILFFIFLYLHGLLHTSCFLFPLADILLST